MRPAAINSAFAEGCVRTGVMFARVYTLSLLFSPWVISAPGHVPPGVQSVATIAVGYVRIGVKFARGRCYRLPLQGLETLLLLLLYLMSVPRPSAWAFPGETNRYGCGLCAHVPSVIAGRCRDWTVFLVLC